MTQPNHSIAWKRIAVGILISPILLPIALIVGLLFGFIYAVNYVFATGGND